jgi:hypothetical protein
MAPRWVVLAWLWLSLPLSLLAYFECPDTRFQQACHSFGNSGLSALWSLPGATAMLAPANAPKAVLVGLPILFTLLCHWAVLRFCPARIKAWWLAAFIVGWAIAGVAAFTAFLFVPHYLYGVGRAV